MIMRFIFSDVNLEKQIQVLGGKYKLEGGLASCTRSLFYVEIS